MAFHCLTWSNSNLVTLFYNYIRNICVTNSNLATHKSSGDHDGRYYTKATIDSRQKLVCNGYTGNGAGIRDITVPGLTAVYFGAIGTGRGNVLYGLDGGAGNVITVAADQNQANRSYFYVAFGV